MYRILLVDDEWLELDTLENYIPWEEMGYQVVGTAENGKVALRLLGEMEERGVQGQETEESALPDVVLTDVKMPVMDGLAFSKILHDKYPDMQIVFLSGYNDFEYVKSALAVEACGYILKPLDPEELKSTMEKVREKCSKTFKDKKSQAVVTAENLKNLLGFSMGEKEELWEDICQSCNTILHCRPENRTFYVGMITIDEYRFLSGYESDGSVILNSIHTAIRKLTNKKILPLHINDHSYLLLSDGELGTAMAGFMKKEGEAARWTTVCLYGSRQSLERMPVLCQEMNRYRRWHVKLYGSGHIISCDGQEESTEGQVEEETAEPEILISYLQNGEKEQIGEWLDIYFLKPRREEGMVKDAFELTERIYASVIETNPGAEEQLGSKAELYGKLSAAEGASLIKDILIQFLEKTADTLAALTGDRRLEVVNQVRHLIELEYDAPLTIEYLAEKVYMSPNYLRTLFKDYTGETVLEYVTRTRINRSAELLRDTNMRVSDISRKVGYENPSHYCAVFRRQMGITPNQFRNKTAGSGRYD